MESRKIAQIILCAKQKQEYRYREQIDGYQGESGVGGTGMDTHTLLTLWIKQIANENILLSTGNLLNTLW